MTPKYSFGHGLSYTTFAYGKIIIEGRTVSCDITNTGLVRGAEVVQLYVGFGDQRFGKDQREETVKQLKGFGKYYLTFKLFVPHLLKIETYHIGISKILDGLEGW